MQIRLKPYHKNLYGVNSLLICGETVQEWIAAICRLNINLDKVETYAVPGLKANSLYGCVLFFNEIVLPKDIRNHQYLQYAENKLLLPEQSVYLPAVNEEELKSLAPGKKILLHPAVGCVILDEPVNWATLLEFENASSAQPKKPIQGVRIPGSINAYTLELNDEKLINDLLNPPSEKEVLENLPFDVKKLMRGNKREMEKYLKYLEAHPDKALDIALPLDVLGSFRGDNKGRFSFSGNWMQRLFGNSAFSGTGGNYTGSGGAKNFWWIGLVGISIIKIVTCNPETHNQIDYSQYKNMAIVKHQSVLDSHYNSIMTSKNMALLYQLSSQNEAQEKRGEKYRLEKQKIKESGKKIKDSLTVMYTAISKDKTDSVVKAWKKFAADSIKKISGKSGFKKLFREAVTAKGEKTYRDYALYYGIIKDSTAADETYVLNNAPEPAVKEEANTNEGKNTGYVLLLTGVLVAIALLFVLWIAPETAKGKISTGGGEISFGKTLLLLIIMTGCIVYILKPLLETYGFGWLSGGVCIFLILLLYRLFAKGSTILNTRK